MSDAQKKAASLFLILAGVGLLGMNYLRTNGTPPQAPEREAFSRLFWMPIEPAAIVASDAFVLGAPAPTLEDVDILAVFFLNAEVCPGCINETVEFADLIKDLEKEGLTVQAVAFVPDEDLALATHFAKTVNLPMPVGYGYPGGFDAVVESTDAGEVLPQIIFVDVEHRAAFFENRVFSSRTSLEAKQAILDGMIRARDRGGDSAALH